MNRFPLPACTCSRSRSGGNLKSGSALLTSDQSWKPCRRKLIFAFVGRGEGTSSEWVLQLDNTSIEEARLRAAAPHGRKSLPCGLNQRPAPLVLSTA
ncbi:hypothetical protein [Alkalicoccus urumqiensis]|uniref:Uncharacterized protein n=1 Tax=Alkalicoccus urumqiensis TaxID=1548213 RepID=A0A2P6MG74_ALKUR|nr:hypothetical protein [Alkalicoccus urumqiensis]PRO65267.1 hypothetical protein C6I21_10725 [Alkalicoccus urumqiensis]